MSNQVILKFLGHSGAFAKVQDGNTNACLTVNGKNLLIDFGLISNIVWREDWGKSFNDINAIFVTHLHLDHCCLEAFFFSRYFIPTVDPSGHVTKPKLFAHPTVLHEIWEHLKPSMGIYRNEVLHLTNFAECHACSDFTFEGVHFKLIKNDHIKSSFGNKDAYGLTFEINSCKIYWSSDAANIDRKLIEWADVVFHDCETFDYNIRSRVHAHYDDLKKLPDKSKSKMWLMHYSESSRKPQQDGFAGFVTKNQEFVF